MLLHAGVILKTSGEQIDDASGISVTDTEVKYKDSNGNSNSIPKSEVSAVLYDNGKYEEIKQQAAVAEDEPDQEAASKSNHSFFNSGKSDNETKQRKEDRTERAEDGSSRGKKEKRMIPQACYADANKVYQAVFKESYEKAVQQGYNKIQAYKIAAEEATQARQQTLDDCYTKIVVEGKNYEPIEIEETQVHSQPSPKPAKKIIPKACYAEANEAYKKAYQEAYDKALQQGYSKMQAYSIAGDAGTEAKKQALDECYDRLVGNGEGESAE